MKLPADPLVIHLLEVALPRGQCERAQSIGQPVGAQLTKEERRARRAGKVMQRVLHKKAP